MEFKEFTAKNVDDAITEACEELMVTSDRLEYEVVSSGSTGFLGINAKPAIIKARIKEEKPVEVESPKVEVADSKESSSKDDSKKKKSTPDGDFKTESEAKKNSNIDGDDLVKKANDFLKDVFEAMKMEVVVNAKFNEQDNILDVELGSSPKKLS